MANATLRYQEFRSSEVQEEEGRRKKNSFHQLPIPNSLLPITNSLLPITNSLLPITNSLLPIPNSLLPIPNYLLILCCKASLACSLSSK
jgi:hypothetical protein